MSWETLVVGQVSFKEDTPVKKIDEAISELKDALECELEWDPEMKSWTFEDVNWLSHVSSEKVEEIAKKYQPFLEYFSFSLFYLDEPNESIVFDGEDITTW